MAGTGAGALLCLVPAVIVRIGKRTTAATQSTTDELLKELVEA